MEAATGATPEFSRRVDVAALPAAGRILTVAATPEERQALARRFGLVALDRLEAEVRLKRVAEGVVRLTATLEAELVQSCVVTLEPVPARLSERFTLVFGDPGDEEEVVLSPESEIVEPLLGDVVDVGEAVAQQVSLSLDPYPRAAGVETVARAENPDAAALSPFAALANRQKKH